MQTFRSLARVLCSGLFKLALYALAIVMAFVMVLGNPAPLKQSLKDSGLYDNLVKNTLNASQDQAGKDSQQSGDTLPLTDPRVEAAAQKAFPPAVLQKDTEHIVDSFFQWLEGSNKTPEFSLDLSAQKQLFIDTLAQSTADQIAGLPACTPAQLRAMAGRDIDYLNLACRPPGINTAVISQQITGSLNQSDNPLSNPVITTETFRDDSGKSPFDNLQIVQRLYQQMMSLPWVLGGLIALSGLGLVLLHDQRRRGLHIMATTLMFVGLFVGLSTLLLYLLIKRLSTGAASQGGNLLHQPLMRFIQDMSAHFNKTLYLFAIGYVVVGLIIWLVLRLTQPKLKVTVP